MKKFSGSDWNVKDIERGWDIIRKSADKRGIDYYTPQIEIISAKEMIELYTYGLPIGYPHWSFGKAYEQNYRKYLKNPHHLAYELVINTEPSICYIMGTNTLAQQLMVIAHAAIGHSNIFKNNIYFKKHTDAKNILNLLVTFKKYVIECEQEYGYDEVEKIIDCGHSLQTVSVNKNLTEKNKEEFILREKMAEARDKSFDDILDSITPRKRNKKKDKLKFTDNILLYVCDKSTFLKPWQKNILLSLQYIAQYLYPQYITKMVNEGFATAVEYLLMDDLYDSGLVAPGLLLECICDGSSVRGQASAFYSFNNYLREPIRVLAPDIHFNPYALGYAILNDLRRISEKPTKEDKQYFPHIIGKNFVEVWKDACHNYRDSNFIYQFLSPAVIRYYKMAAVFDDRSSDYYVVDYISKDQRYNQIKDCLAKTFDNQVPFIELEISKDDPVERHLTLDFKRKNGVSLDEGYKTQCLENIRYLMNYSKIEIKETK